MAPRGRILYYCQSLVGVGHLVCSLRVGEALLPHFDVDLVHGGLDVAPAAVPEGLRRLRLPTLLHDEESGDFFDPEGGTDLEAVWAARRQAIAAFLRPPYRAVVLEFWPFGRRRFKPEITALLDHVRASSGPVPVFTSVREVLVPRPVANERRMVESVRRHIHTVFVRGDERVLPFGETFGLAGDIADRVVHTGYIGPPAPARPPPRSPARRAQVLVSQGGGDVGRELLRAAAAAAPRLPGLHFLLAAGARTPAAEVEALRASVRSANVEVLPFLADFPQQVAGSALSINMGGDNTLLEVLCAGTPSLAYPYPGNPEQGIRIRRFADKGLVHEMGPGDLAPERLQQRIEAALQAPPPAFTLAVDGARVTAERIRDVLAAAA